MKILIANKFFYPKGGADVVFLDTAKLLQKKGHEVVFFAMKGKKNLQSEDEKYFVSNVEYEGRNLFGIVKAALRTLYSLEARKNMERLIVDRRPDIAHLHSIYHQISPSIIHSLQKYKIPIVMTLHDYKLVCGSYLFMSHGKVCESCKDGAHYQAFLQGCVKDSAVKSLLISVEMHLHHNIMRIYDKVDIFITPSIFMKNKIAEAGFKGRVVHLPNFIMIEEFSPSYEFKERSIVYLGRLSKEKGVHTLIGAFRGVRDVRLKIIGEGPIREDLEIMIRAEGLNNIDFLGYMSGADMKEEISRSMFVVLPSECYENNPRAVMESFALGKPVIGARIGGIPELVRDGETGLTFEAFNREDLRLKIERLAGDPDEIIRMGKNARSFAESELTAERHYERLMEVYKLAIDVRRGLESRGGHK